MRESYYSSGFRELGTRTQLTLDPLRGLVTNDLQSAAAYEATLERAWGVLRQQSGIVKLPSDKPAYVLQDVQGDGRKIKNFLGQRVPFLERSPFLVDALRDNRATAVLLGDIAHSQAEEQWERDENHVTSVARDELAATMNAQQLAFGLVAALPGNFFWVSGNHDRQRLIPFGTTNDKNLAIAKAMQQKLGSDLLAKWIETEDMLPLMAVNRYVILSHAAPGADVDVVDIIGKKDTAFAKMAGTENRPGKPENMTEDEMSNNMQAIITQLDVDLDPQWVWMIGHRQTDNEPEGFRRQCGDRLIQINQTSGQLFAVILPGGSVSVGDCRFSDPPTHIIRNVV